jgi:hypothetical protein
MFSLPFFFVFSKLKAKICLVKYKKKERKKMRIIFLDVDGVLNSLPYNDKNKNKNNNISDIYLKRLAQIYHSFNDTKIVLSSSWKNAPNDHYMKKYLYEKLNQYDLEIIDETPSYDINNKIIGDRPKEILEWLNRHPNIKDWVSIEDDWKKEEYEKIQKNLSKRLIETSYFVEKEEDGGIKEKDVEKAIEILRGGKDNE